MKYKSAETLIIDGDEELNPTMLQDMSELKRIVVCPGNKRYVSHDGVLYTRDLTQLVCYPAGRTQREYTAFTVSCDNACYAERDGVLFSKEFSVLYACPKGDGASDYAVPDAVTEIADHAFSESRLGSVTIPTSAKKVGRLSFWEMRGTLMGKIYMESESKMI